MLNNSAYLVFDTEAGGINVDKSLLTAYFVVADDNFNVIDELSLFLKSEDDIYRVTAEALSINKINLIEHDEKAITYKEGGTALYKFLWKNSNAAKIKLVPVGHGMTGDLAQIFDKLMSRKTWEMFVSYRRLDTSVALQFLKCCGLFSEEISGSLESLINHFNIKCDMLHDARCDTLATMEVLKRLIDVVNKLKI